ncbi:MAG: hypothetical protein ACRDHW_18915, partial [Ktedonobacteraceae bacterium]
TVLHDAFHLTQSELEEHEAWMSEYTLQRTYCFLAFDMWSVVRTAGRAGYPPKTSTWPVFLRVWSRMK